MCAQAQKERKMKRKDYYTSYLSGYKELLVYLAENFANNFSNKSEDKKEVIYAAKQCMFYLLNSLGIPEPHDLNYKNLISIKPELVSMLAYEDVMTQIYEILFSSIEKERKKVEGDMKYLIPHTAIYIHLLEFLNGINEKFNIKHLNLDSDTLNTLAVHFVELGALYSNMPHSANSEEDYGKIERVKSLVYEEILLLKPVLKKNASIEEIKRKRINIFEILEGI